MEESQSNEIKADKIINKADYVGNYEAGEGAFNISNRGLIFIGTPEDLPQDTGGKVLIIEGDIDNYNTATEKLGKLHPDQSIKTTQNILTEEAGQHVSWYEFNDRRFNGILSADQWRKTFPNLRLIAQRDQRSQTLSSILNEWNVSESSKNNLILIIRQGDPLRILMGAEEWLPNIREVHVMLFKEDKQDFYQVQEWLQQKGYTRRFDNKHAWERNLYHEKLISLQSVLKEKINDYSHINNLLQDSIQHNNNLKAEISASRQKMENLTLNLHQIFSAEIFQAIEDEPNQFSDDQLIELLCGYQNEDGGNMGTILRDKLNNRYLEYASIQKLREKLEIELNNHKKALLHLFPYEVYRSQRPDLNTFEDKQLAEHFAIYGMKEGVELSCNDIWLQNEKLKLELDNLAEQKNNLEEEIKSLTGQVSLLKDICTRFSV